MIDVLGEGLRAAAARSPLAVPLVFGAGLLTSVGPCIAPRYVAVAALAQAARRPWIVVAAFVAGLAAAYVTLGLAAGALGVVWSTSRWVYLALAAILALTGIATLLRDERRHDHAGASRLPGSVGGTFLLGASSAFVVSPCCTPVVAGIAGLTVGARPLDGALLLLAFACGHAVPLVGAAALGRRVSALLSRLAASQAPSIVASTLMLALASYYGALA